MKKIFSICILLSFLTMVGCVEDNGNYTYTDIDQVVIDTTGRNIQSDYVVSRFDTLTIAPRIIYNGQEISNGDNAPLDYVWTLYTTHSGAGVDYTVDTLATTCVLHQPITRTAGEYRLQLTVRNRDNGVEEYFQTTCKVEESITAGWMVLYEPADEPSSTDIGLVVNEWTKKNIIRNREFWDLYKSSNGAHLEGAPLTVLHTAANLAQGDAIMIFTTKTFAGVNYATLEKIMTFDNLFYHVPSSYDVSYYGANGAMAFGETVINANKVYTTSFMARRNDFFGVAKSGSYGKLASWASATHGTMFDAVVYDQTAQRFLCCPRGGVSLLSFAPQDPNGAFDVNNVGMELLMGDYGNSVNYYDYLLFAKGEERYLAVANFGTRSNQQLPNIGVALYNISKSPDIQNATSWQSAYLGQFVLYSAGNKVYNLAYNRSTEGKVLWTAPNPDEEVTCVRLQKYYSMALHSRIMPYANQIIHIATWNSKAKEGKLYEYLTNPASGALIGEPKVYKVPGKVKEMGWKYAMEM